MTEIGVQSATSQMLTSRPEEKPSIISEIYDYVGSIVFGLALVILVTSFTFKQVSVGGVSMENTFNAGVVNENTYVDRVLISDINYTHPKRGDVVVIDAPALHERIIKRVIGIGGDIVNIDFQKHTVSVNGKILKEPYIKEPTAEQGNVKFPVTVPKGYVFVMGDNRNDSYDSRFSAVGMVDIKDIAGKVFLRVYLFNEIKWFNSPF